jgi:hypothetical protein
VITFNLQFSPLNELADREFNLIPNVVLDADVIEYSSSGINDNRMSDIISLSCFPNPSPDASTISYQIPQNGIVTLWVNDILGHKMISLLDEFQEKGCHLASFDMKNLVPGIYMVSIHFKNNTENLKKTIMVLRNR